MKILLIDDEEMILRTLKELLTRLGHDIVTAASGPDGLDKFFNAPDSFKTIITDVKMPGFDGVELADRLASKGYVTPIILTTGHVEIQNTLGPTYLGVLYKPFKVADLLDILDSVETPDGIQ